MAEQFEDIMRVYGKFIGVTRQGPVAGRLAAYSMQAQARNAEIAGDAAQRELRTMRDVLNAVVETASAQVNAQEELTRLARRSQKISGGWLPEDDEQALPPSRRQALPSASRPALAPYVSDDTVRQEATRIAMSHPRPPFSEADAEAFWKREMEELGRKGYDAGGREQIADRALDIMTAGG